MSSSITSKRQFPIDSGLVYQQYRKFWDTSYKEHFLTMAGIADIWESPQGNFENSFNGIDTIGGLQIYKDRIFIVQGYGMQTLVKVISPSGIEVYGLGANAMIMKSCNKGLEGNFTVLNEDELIIGYLYVNLKRQFSAPFGIDLSELYGHKNWKVVNARINSTSWLNGLQGPDGWKLVVLKRSSMEDCFDCNLKRQLASASKKFQCEQEDRSFTMRGFSFAKRATRSMLQTGVSTSITRMGGLSKMDDIPLPASSGAGCLYAIERYRDVFKFKNPNIQDIGEAGSLVSEKCASYMLQYVVEIGSYRDKTEYLYDEYTHKSINGDADTHEWLLKESKDALSTIAPALTDIVATSTDDGSLDALFSDIVWWAPLWFVMQDSKIKSIPIGDAYAAARRVDKDSFISALKNAAKTAPGLPKERNFGVKWVLTSQDGTKPTKLAKNTATFYSFPMGICYSMDLIATIDRKAFDWICEVETRADGLIIWAWKDKAEYEKRFDMVLKCFKLTLDGIFTEIASLDTGRDSTPLSGSAKSVSVSSDNTFFMVKDYYLVDGEKGPIDYTETKVEINADMTEILNLPVVNHYANLDEFTLDFTMPNIYHWGDGMFEKDWKDFDLDDSQVRMMESKKIDYATFIKGYSTYKVGDLGSW